MERIKLIWDFRGGDAEGMAKHHAMHLAEFAKKAGLPETQSHHEAVEQNHWMAWMVVPADRMIEFRDALRPHRGQQLG